jgi:hypothetical protein
VLGMYSSRVQCWTYVCDEGSKQGEVRREASGCLLQIRRRWWTLRALSRGTMSSALPASSTPSQPPRSPLMEARAASPERQVQVRRCMVYVFGQISGDATP